MSDDSPTILVVDDNENNRDLISRRLKRAGYAVETAEDGYQALERLKDDGIDLVILDIMMPGLTGIDVLHKVRKEKSGQELPIIMATAKDQSEDVVEALDAGANDYVTKPLDFPVIMARIQTQLRMRVQAPEAEESPEAPTRSANDADFVPLIGAIRPGMVLGGKYRLESEIGQGNFGAVYRATHLGFDHPVAVKILQASVEDSPEALARFQQEGRSSFKLQHPNAVSVMDFSVTPAGLAYLVMEKLDGSTLEDELRQRPQMSPMRAAEIILPICEVLQEAHSMGIIHRDIKPANIFLHRVRGQEVVKVLDFGIAKLVGDNAMNQNLTLDEGILGTPAYMAPERLWGKPYDGRADAYSVGIMLYQMLAGRPPFWAPKNEAMAVAMMHVTTKPDPVRTHRKDVTPDLESAIMAMLDKDHERRPDVAKLGRRLCAALNLPVPAALMADSEADTVPGDLDNAFAFSDLLTPPSAPLLPVEQETAKSSVILFPPDMPTERWTRQPTPTEGFTLKNE